MPPPPPPSTTTTTTTIIQQPLSLVVLLLLLSLQVIINIPSPIESSAAPTSAPIFTAYQPHQCTSSMKLNYLPTSGGATCADGSPAIFYSASPHNSLGNATYSTQYLIWLGEGPICGSESECADICSRTIDDPNLCSNNTELIDTGTTDPTTPIGRARCYFRKLTCTSSWYSNWTTLPAETLMCDDDPEFSQYHRIYVPACSMDWFMGRGHVDSSITTTLWKGAYILDALFDALDTTGIWKISEATRVVIGGTSGSGVGVVNNFNRLRQSPRLYLVPNVMMLLDSAFLVSQERFANLTKNKWQGAVNDVIDDDLRKKSATWIGRAELDTNCVTIMGAGQKTRCLYTSEVMRRGLLTERIMIVQSQYDLALMSQLDVFNTSLSIQFVDNASYAQGANNFIEAFGANTRRTIEATAYLDGPSDYHFFYSTSCGQYGYVVPSALESVAPRKADLGKAGSMEYRRDYLVWARVEVGQLSVRTAIVRWLQSDGLQRPVSDNLAVERALSIKNGIRGDKCASFLCNPTCTEEIFAFRLSDIWGQCNRRIVYAYCGILLSSFWFMFILAGLAVIFFRYRYSKYWRDVRDLEQMEKDANPAQAAEMDQKMKAEAETELIRDAYASQRKVHLMLRDVSYWAKPRRGAKQAYQILREVSASFPPGQVHALMGPSGSGKSTILDLITLNRDSGWMTGTHYVNGLESHKSVASFLRDWLGHNVSYVRQQDNLFPLLTVREHLTHAAWLMLPEFMDYKQKLRRVWQVLKIMDLDKAADTICGDGGIAVEGGISGGQRRRVSVATQLLRLPAALILDEPTSGLDSTSALTLVKALHMLAHRGGTNIIMTIHQPRREIYRYLDTLKILVQGRLLFAGAPKEAFFHFDVSTKLNIGDEILDQLAKARPEHIIGFQEKYLHGTLGRRMEEEMLNEVVLDFDFWSAVALRDTLIATALAEGRWSWTESSSSPTLMYVLLSRTIKRGGFDVFKTVVMSLFGGILVGIVFLGAKDTYTRRTAMSYLSVATMTFLQGTFIGDRYWAEKFMYDFESEAGTARPWISFLASMFSRLIVSSTTEALAFAIPVFFLGRMTNEGSRFQTYLLMMVMTAITTANQYLMVEIYFMKPDDKRTGALVNIALLSLAALFNGFIIQLNDLPVYFRWVPITMLSYWGFVGNLINDIQGFSIECHASQLECAARSGDTVIRGLKYDDRDIAMCLFSLLCMTAITLFLSTNIFFWKYVYKFGNGLTRKTSKELRTKEEEFKSRARELQRLRDANGGGSTSTMNAVLETGKLAKQNSGKELKRGDSGGKNLGRSNSLTETGGAKTLIRAPSADGTIPSEMDVNGLMDDADTAMEGEPEITAETDGRTRCQAYCHADLAFVRMLVSRLVLVAYFIIDTLAASTICYGQESASIDGDATNLGGLNSTNVVNSLADSGDSITRLTSGTGSNALFVTLDVLFLIGYIIQFVVQLFLLWPRNMEGKLQLCTRLVLYDLLGAAFSVIDLVLFFVLVAVGSDVAQQIYLLIAIRIIRAGRIMSYWFKIGAFHKLRAQAYLVLKNAIMAGYDPTAAANQVRVDDFNVDDTKPPVPPKNTKPKIPAGLKLPKNIGAIAQQQQQQQGRKSNRIPSLGGMLRSVQTAVTNRISLGRSNANAGLTAEERQRISLQNKRASVQPRAAPVVPPRQAAMVPTWGSVLDGGGGGGGRMSVMRGAGGNRISLMRGGGGGGASSAGFTPAIPGRSAGMGNSNAPVVPPRFGQTLGGFGITPQAQKMFAPPPGLHARRADEPGADEV
jgi:ABC-type multidrug transport system ATPase subunit